MNPTEANNDTLPGDLSGLLRVAIADMEGLDRDRYQPNSGDWHEPSAGAKYCRVCLAGGVMAGTMQVPHGASVTPAEATGRDHDTHNRLQALDDLRSGDVWAAAFSLTGGYHRNGDMAAFAASPEAEKADALICLHPELLNRVRARRRFIGWREWDELRPIFAELADALEQAGL
ncbi:MAG: hypothetical protein OXC11_08645 [Rhodospirillales bacterium]|nr:hypothetical protein [Rhodospirillales bacterium]